MVNGNLTGVNLFAYCGNDPINRIDPTGEAWWHWAIGAAIVVACAVAVVVTAGGAAAGISAVASVANGVAAASTASTVAAGAFIGSSIAYGSAVLTAASNSDSIQDFNEQGNWDTVAATAIGVAAGSAYGYSVSCSFKSVSKHSPNPYGRKGGPAHQAEIHKQTVKYQGSAEIKYEVKIKTPGGSKPYRYADFSITQNGKTWYGNVGRQLKSGAPCAREMQAINDIVNAGKTIKFYPYN